MRQFLYTYYWKEKTMKKSEFFKIMAVVFGVASLVSILLGRSNFLSVVLVGVFVCLFFLFVFWGVYEENFRIRFDVEPPLWRRRKNRNPRETEIFQQVVYGALGRLFADLGAKRTELREAEKENNLLQESLSGWKSPVKLIGSNLSEAARTLRNLGRTRHEAEEAWRVYNRARKLAKRFGFSS